MRYVLIAAIIWGSSFPVIKYALDGVSPLLFLSARFTLAFLIFVPFIRSKSGFAALFNKGLIFVGLFHAAGFVAQYFGQSLTTASKSALFVNASPLFVVLIQAVVLRKLPERQQFVALILALTGVFFVSVGLDFQSLSDVNPGDVLNLGSAFCWGMVVILSGRVVEQQGEVVFSAGLCLWTVLMTAPLLWLEPLRFDPIAVAPLIYLAVFPTVVAYFSYSRGIRTVSALATSIVFLVEVLVAGLISYVGLSESFTVAELMGFVLVMAGVWLTVRR